jgi:hypothetical protein
VGRREGEIEVLHRREELWWLAMAAAGTSRGDGACARVEGCGAQANAEKEVQGLELGFYIEG